MGSFVLRLLLFGKRSERPGITPAQAEVLINGKVLEEAAIGRKNWLFVGSESLLYQITSPSLKKISSDILRFLWMKARCRMERAKDRSPREYPYYE